ncbi:MAG: 8-oxoguanine deaminase, partial [Paracoccaceae bacterium]
MDDERRELRAVDIHVKDGQIAAIGQGLRITNTTDVVDGSSCIVTPGLVNTHHHLYQTLTRAVPGGQDALLFGWLQTLYPIWAKFSPEHMRISALV